MTHDDIVIARAELEARVSREPYTATTWDANNPAYFVSLKTIQTAIEALKQAQEQSS